MQRRRSALIAVLVTALVALGLGSFGSAQASTTSLSAKSVSTKAVTTKTLSTKAASWTPTIGADSTVWKLQQCGNTMYAVGAFSQVTQGGRTYTRNNAFSFSATTGKLTSWNPNINGPVYALAVSKNCALAYVGGSFKQVGSSAAMNLAAVSTTSGKLWNSFAHSANATVHSIIFVRNYAQLLVGGYFTKLNGYAANYYVSVNRLSGAKTNYLRASISGKVANAYKGYTMVWNQQVSKNGSALLVEGDFTTVGGHRHVQVAELNLTSTMARVSSWTNAAINSGLCSDTIPFYIRGGAFSPDQKTIYLATTGNTGSSPYCDAVSAFENTSSAKNKWINKTGHDSLYTVAASARGIVYIGGHEKYADNPYGYDTCGKGCVARPGIGAINASTGKATSWNPTRDRGKGADDLLITSAGLWVASDTYYSSVKCAGVAHGGICFFPGSA